MNQRSHEALIEILARLRPAGDGTEHRSADTWEAIRDLEALVGPTIGRRQAARHLGISQTALDRWINRGEIGVVLTLRGRTELTLSSFLDLLAEVRASRGRGTRRPVAAVIEERRRRAAAITPDTIGLRPAEQDPGNQHRRVERSSLAYHRVVASRLDDDLVNAARSRLRRWCGQGSIHPEIAEAWDQALRRPQDELGALLRQDDDDATELRQSSPFAGSLTEQDRHRILELVD